MNNQSVIMDELEELIETCLIEEAEWDTMLEKLNISEEEKDDLWNKNRDNIWKLYFLSNVDRILDKYMITEL